MTCTPSGVDRDGEAGARLDQASPKLRASRPSRGRLWGVAVAMVAAVLLLLLLLPPAPLYTATWQTSSSRMRGVPAQVGRFEVNKVAKLLVRPATEGHFKRPQLKVYLAPKGEPLREASQFRARQGTTGAIRISLPITDGMSPGAHTVVVLLGTDLKRATPDLPAWWWSRIETELEVLETI